VLIVDDERDIESLYRQKFRKELRDGLLDFHFSFSGSEALDYMHMAGVDHSILVLSDINMPGMNGLDLLKSIKNEFPGLRVLMVTAYGDIANFETARNLGADGFITKPIDFEMLRKEIFANTEISS
jgi:DNA-binding NtrC family response regulator